MAATMNSSPALLLAALVSGPALAATDADLARCRVIADPGQRLACYDVLAPAVAGAVPAAPPPPPAVPAAKAAPAVEFGFELRAWDLAPQAVDSRIVGAFDGWEPNSRIRLENGQVWQVTDGSRGVMAVRDPKVTISRGSFGTFFLEIEGRRQAPRVRRVE
jgi:hypothetical protein